jgi:hypothetical protein
MVDEYRLSASEPSGCLASAGKLEKLIYSASPGLGAGWEGTMMGCIEGRERA